MTDTMPARRSLAILLLGATFTVVAVLYIFLRVNWRQFADMDLSIDWFLLGSGVVFIIGIYLVSSLRWMLLLQGQIGFPAACLVVFIGHGLNAILPARGGDIVKLIYMQKTWGVALGRGAIRLLLEKTLDLVFVVLMAIMSWAMFLSDRLTQLTAPISLVLVLVLLLVLAAQFPSLLSLLLKRMLVRLPNSGQLAQWQETAMQELSELLRSRQIALAGLLTLAIWFVLEFVFVFLIAGSLQIHLNYQSALLIIACGALSVGLPSAPSGIGVYHAAVMGAFELLGYPAEQGLVAATLLHLANTIPVLVLGGITYTFNRRREVAPRDSANVTAIAETPTVPPATPSHRQ